MWRENPDRGIFRILLGIFATILVCSLHVGIVKSVSVDLGDARWRWNSSWLSNWNCSRSSPHLENDTKNDNGNDEIFENLKKYLFFGLALPKDDPRKRNVTKRTILFERTSAITDDLQALCSAPYPIQIIYEREDFKSPKNSYESSGNGNSSSSSSSSFMSDSKVVAEYEGEENSVTYKDWSIHSTYYFNSIMKFNLHLFLFTQGQKFTCHSVRNPCIRKTWELVVQENWLNFTLLEQETVQQSKSIPVSAPSSVTKNQMTQEEEEECDAIFYYEETTTPSPPVNSEFPNYSTRCQFADGSPGHVKTFYCDTHFRCNVILKLSSSSRQQKKNCWRQFEPRGQCSNCSSAWTINQPFLAMCTNKKSKTKSGSGFGSPDDGFSLEKIMSQRRSFLSLPAFFSVPQGYRVRPQIFFGRDLENPKVQQQLLFMEEFDEVQPLNSLLWIRCHSSRYFFSKTFQFAIEYKISSSSSSATKLLVLPSTEINTFLEKINRQAQTTPIPLTKTVYTRIYCFAQVAHTYEWRNVSRPIRVVEPREFFEPPSSQCQSSRTTTEGTEYAKNPHFSITSAVTNGLTGDGGPETKLVQVYLDPFWQQGFPVLVNCTANFPVRLRYKFNTDNRNTDFAIDQNTDMSRSFSDFNNVSTYEFYIQNYFKFKNTTKTQIFRCESQLNPCKHESVEYSYDKKSNAMTFQFFTSEDQNEKQLENKNKTDSKFKSNEHENNEKSKTKANTITTESALNTNTTKTEEDDECQVIFYYEKVPGFPGYSFRCDFPYGISGVVKATVCAPCDNLYPDRRQPSSCWREYNRNKKTCSGCKEWTPPSLAPIVVTCEVGNLYNNEYYQESYRGNFAFFGLWNKLTKKPVQLYFSENDVDPNSMIFLDDFYKYQVTGNELNVTCRTYVLFFVQKIHFALGFHGNSEIQFLPDPDFTFSQDTQTFEASLNFKLNDTRINRIYCISGLQNSFQYVNYSRPIVVQELRKPQVFLQVSMPQTSNLRSTPNKGSKIGREIQNITTLDWTFDVLSVNQSLGCLATGYPPPKISWISSSDNITQPVVTSKNDGAVLSQLHFSQIYPKIAGNYLCRAENVKGSAKQFLDIKVKEPDPRKTLAISITIPVLGLLLIFSAIAVVTRRHIRKLEKEIRDLTPAEIRQFFEGSSECSENSSGAEENPTENMIQSIPYDRKYEMTLDEFEIDEDDLLGQGEFGIVMKGVFNRNGREETVAIKTGKSDVDVVNFIAILKEIKILTLLESHENICKLVGVCTAKIQQRQVWIAVEFCAEKDLKSFLGNNSKFCENLFNPPDLDPELAASGYAPMETLFACTLNTVDLLRFSKEISNGMAYLTTKNVIHGDLAARNILLDENLQVKISDFGLSRQLVNYSTTYVQKCEGRIPWAWMSIEALEEKRFSIKSDVWSFGVVLWEIFSMAQTPYDSFVLCRQFLDGLKQGYRLEIPDWANDEIYEIMTSCWQYDPVQRPPFRHLYEKLELLYTKTNSITANE